jgi:hypothetical protein
MRLLRLRSAILSKASFWFCSGLDVCIMPCMSERSLVTFHTAPNEVPHYSYQKPPYREIIGFSANGSHLWTPRASEGAPYTSQEYRLDSEFAARLGTFFGDWFKDPDLAWNCHMAAAGMRGLEGWHDEPTARKYAQAVLAGIEYDPQETNSLAEGQQGVYAVGPWRLEHSVIGLGKNAQGQEEHIQLNGTNEPYASILPAAYNHEYFFGDSPQTRFYAPERR